MSPVVFFQAALLLLSLSSIYFKPNYNKFSRYDDIIVGDKPRCSPNILRVHLRLISKVEILIIPRGEDAKIEWECCNKFIVQASLNRCKKFKRRNLPLWEHWRVIFFANKCICTLVPTWTASIIWVLNYSYTYYIIFAALKFNY